MQSTVMRLGSRNDAVENPSLNDRCEGAIKHGSMDETGINVHSHPIGIAAACVRRAIHIACALAAFVLSSHSADAELSAEELAKIQAEMFCAFGADDAGIPMENVKKFEGILKDAGRNAVVKVYDGDPHSFFNDTKPSYRPDAAKDAWERSLALFRRVLA